MECKLCQHDSQIVRAHVIPRSFYEINSLGHPQIVSTTDRVFPKRAPIGIYDTHLVCEKCEQMFAPFDDYAQLLLLAQRATAMPLFYDGKPIAYVYEAYNYTKLKLFFLSLLWRISQSSHDFFKHFTLGKHEAAVRTAILSSDPGPPEFYAVILAKFPTPLGNLDPRQIHLLEVNFCSIYLAEYVAYIKVDRRATPEPLRDFVLGREARLVLLARDPSRSKDTQVMRVWAMKNARL